MVIMIDLMMILIMVPDKQTTLDAQSHYLISSVECTFVSENVWDYEEQAMTFGLTKYWKSFENLSIWVIFGHLV